VKDKTEEWRLSIPILGNETKPDFGCLKEIPVDSLDLARRRLHKRPSVAGYLEQQKRYRQPTDDQRHHPLWRKNLRG